MRVGIPVAAYHEGNPGEYVARALGQLGHTPQLLTPAEFYDAAARRAHELYFAVDSSAALDVGHAALAGFDFGQLLFWFIDFRHNWNRPTRVPNDLEVARQVTRRGGLVFQAQAEDVQLAADHGVTTQWLPLGADPEIWSDSPAEEKRFDIGFIGNIWDESRLELLRMLLSSSLRVGVGEPGKFWKQQAAQVMRSCRIGFNVSSFFGTPYAYDVNMRVFETLSCGVPLLTNEAPALWKIFPRDAAFIRTYRTAEELSRMLVGICSDSAFLASGPAARQWIVANGAYKQRVAQALDVWQRRSQTGKGE